MSIDVTTSFSLISIGVTLLGWLYTGFKHTELVKIQGKIQINMSESEKLFDSLHPRRVDVMFDLHKNMIAISKFMDNWDTDGATKAIITMSEYYELNSLFLDESLCNEMDILLSRFLSVRGNYLGDWSAE